MIYSAVIVWICHQLKVNMEMKGLEEASLRERGPEQVMTELSSQSWCIHGLANVSGNHTLFGPVLA